MSTAATVRVMSPEEIAARAGGETPFLVLPHRETLFAERAMRLRQLSRHHAMGDYLAFMAELAMAQHAALQTSRALLLPDASALDAAARAGLPPLRAADGPRSASWQTVLQEIVATLRPRAPAPTLAVLDRLGDADSAWLDRQADALLSGMGSGLDLATAPLIAAALQVQWTDAVLQVQAHGLAHGQAHGAPFGRTDEAGLCPCCGSRPTASLTRSAGDAPGLRYLHCSLCSAQWNLVRSRCTHCGSDRSLAYQALDLRQTDPAAEASVERTGRAAVQAETCDDCHHYLKIVHADRDPFVDPVADDLASLTLDLLVADTGMTRHGVNLMLFFGEGDADPPPGSA